jgi:thymidylate synthase ThyX
LETLRTFQDIEVKLVGQITSPYELAIATARTCYSGKGVIYPEDVSKDERSIQLRDRIASSTMEAGHLTTRQHAHFVFALSGVSRQFIWSFLHSHPFYNSEQVSQRYVRVKRGSFVAPPLPNDALEVYTQAVDAQMGAYEGLIEALRPTLSHDYYERFKARKKYADKWNPSIDKRCYEVARYALGVGTTAYLYHTVSALTLLRYARLCEMFETPTEQRLVIQQMLDAVKATDPLFDKEIPDPLPLEKTLEYECVRKFSESARQTRKEFISEFDRDLEGRTSKLVNYSHDAEKVIGTAVRTALGRTKSELSDADAVDLMLDPKLNPSLADTLGVTTLDKLDQILHHVHFTFQKKISHTADSQDQRHRMVMSSRPVLLFHYTGQPDYITPYGITQNEKALEIYEQSMKRSFQAVNQLLEMGVKEEFAFYLLPNAFPIRMISSGDLQAYHHKWKMRSCYNAQEEIFRATVDEIEQVRSLFPRVGEHLRAPCYLRLRAGITPFCPEGDRYCGLPVWKYQITDYARKSL